MKHGNEIVCQINCHKKYVYVHIIENHQFQLNDLNNQTQQPFLHILYMCVLTVLLYSDAKLWIATTINYSLRYLTQTSNMFHLAKCWQFMHLNTLIAHRSVIIMLVRCLIKQNLIVLDSSPLFPDGVHCSAGYHVCIQPVSHLMHFVINSAQICRLTSRRKLKISYLELMCKQLATYTLSSPMTEQAYIPINFRYNIRFTSYHNIKYNYTIYNIFLLILGIIEDLHIIIILNTIQTSLF